ncbi:MAG: hypothetical protein HN348_07690, partial [Proteobacteria bacterium]|nr:hypothetical protein [Pseudomonadota bacterium]
MPIGSDDSNGRLEQKMGNGAVFHDLMKRRVSEILLVSSLYDSFVLDEGGQLGDHLLTNYMDLNLRHTPRLTRASTPSEALSMMRYRRFDLVLTMMRSPDKDSLAFCQTVKHRFPQKPLVALVHDSIGLNEVVNSVVHSVVDHVLVWSGDSRLLLAIIKLIEDRWNVDHDTKKCGVRTFLVVEDSVRQISSFLPMLYAELMTQTHKVMVEGHNYMDKLLRIKARPKLLLAHDFEEAKVLFRRHESTMMAVISDVEFPRDGLMDQKAGFTLLKWIRGRETKVPAMIHSGQATNRAGAESMGCFFLDKNSRTWLEDLREFFVKYLGFGDFVFRLPSGKKVGRAANIREMERMLLTIPDESLTYHLQSSHFSSWLMARAEYSLAAKIRTTATS